MFRLLRIAVIPGWLGVALAAAAWIEEQDWGEWSAENPARSRVDYACEVAALTAEVVDGEMWGLPAAMRPEPFALADLPPSCVAALGFTPPRPQG